MQKWLLAMRPWSFTASVIPLTLGAALAWTPDAVHAGLFLLTLLGGVAIQTGTNMLNLYGDYRSGVDTEASVYGESPILLGLISPETMRRGGLIALCAAFGVGIALGFACGWPILAGVAKKPCTCTRPCALAHTASCPCSSYSASCRCPGCCPSRSRRVCTARCGRSTSGLFPNPNSYPLTAYPQGIISCSGCCSLREYCCRAVLNRRKG